MPGIIFSESSGLNDSIYGKVQAPIQMFLEKRGEQFEQKSALKDLFFMGPSENFGDLLTSMTAMNGFQPVGENGAYPEDGMQEGYNKMLVYETWKDSFSISQEMIEDGKLMDLTKAPEAFSAAYYRTREQFGASLYAGAITGKTKVKFGGKVFDTSAADGQQPVRQGARAQGERRQAVQLLQGCVQRGRAGPGGDGNAPVPGR